MKLMLTPYPGDNSILGGARADCPVASDTEIRRTEPFIVSPHAGDEAPA
jgi:hypothetical protein